MVNTASRVLLSAAAVVVGVLYLVETSSVATKGYDINDLQKQISNLKRENQRLELSVAEFRSMASIQERIKTLNLVTANDIVYVSGGGVAMARR